MSFRTSVLAFCMASLSFTMPPVVVAATAEDIAERSVVGDPILTSFVIAVIEGNPRVQAARAAVDAGIALEDAAERPLYNPTLDFDAENADSKTRSIGLSQTIDWGGKRKARTSVAEFDRRAIEADFRSTRWQVTADLLSGLADYQTESDRYLLSTERASFLKDFAELAGQRFDAGDLNQIEFDLATLIFAEARMQKATAGAGVAEAKRAVSSIALNSPPPEWPSLSAKLPALAAAFSDPREMVETLPEVVAAQMRLQAAIARVDLRNRERRLDPTLSLRGGTEDDESLIGINMSFPLPVRNRLDNEVIAANAQRRQIEQVASNISRAAYVRVISARERYQLSHDAWRDWESTGGVSLIRQSDLLRRLWEAGELSTTEFLVQIEQTLDTQESALELRRALWRAWFEWLVASGQVDRWINLEGLK